MPQVRFRGRIAIEPENLAIKCPTVSEKNR